MRFESISRAAVAALAIIGVTCPVGAATLKVDYRITLAGLTLGQADLSGTIDDAHYALEMKAQLTGIAGLISGSGRGGATSTGAIAGSRLSSAGFSAIGRTGSTERTVRIAMSSGRVGEIDIKPPFELRPDRVPVTEADRQGVIDPLSAVLALSATRSKAEPAACNRTIPVFDGTQRFNVVLTYAETKPVTKPGFAGDAVVCNARYVPIAGHRPTRWVVKYMEENRDMSVWLAPVEGTRVLVPIRIDVQTYFGMSVVEAEKWTVQ